MALPPDVQNAIDDIRAVIDSGRPLIMGKVFIDEQAFYIGTSRLKKSLPESWGQMATVRRSNAENFNSLVQIDELEMIAERGKFHVFGKVLVDEQACLQKLESVQAALIKDIAEAQAWSAAHPAPVTQPAPATTDVQVAQTEAERIIAEAKIEAERIKEEARRQSESPWNG
jgi:hypothetical protein